MKGNCPSISDFSTEEEYNEALEAYETAEYWAIEEANERYYGRN